LQFKEIKFPEYIQKSCYDRWRSEVLFQGWGEHYRSQVPFLFGLCSSYRRKVLEEIEGFDPYFKISGEDMDLSFRLQHAGYRLVYNPEAYVYHMRSDTYQSIVRMTYRHCFWGFVAQRKNSIYQNKVSFAVSIRTFIRQILSSGLAKLDFGYAGLTIRLHLVILRAWIDSRRKDALVLSYNSKQKYEWEGHTTHFTAAHNIPEKE